MCRRGFSCISVTSAQQSQWQRTNAECLSTGKCTRSFRYPVHKRHRVFIIAEGPSLISPAKTNVKFLSGNWKHLSLSIRFGAPLCVLKFTLKWATWHSFRLLKVEFKLHYFCRVSTLKSIHTRVITDPQVLPWMPPFQVISLRWQSEIQVSGQVSQQINSHWSPNWIPVGNN